jgi:hypothetical protein
MTRNTTKISNGFARELVMKVFVSILILVTTSAVNANLIQNDGFETGDTSEWTSVNGNINYEGAEAYADAFGGAINPPYNGGVYGGFQRPGDNIEMGFSQTVSVVPSVELQYSLDFTAREVQIPGDSRGDQTISLRLNGDLVDQQVMISGGEQFGSFSGNYTPNTGTVTFSMTSLRVVSFATGSGQVFFDNATLDCAEGQSCIRINEEPSPAKPIPAMGTKGLLLMSLMLGLLGLAVIRRID